MADAVTLGFRGISFAREAWRLLDLNQDCSNHAERSYLNLATLACQTLLLGTMAFEVAKGGSKSALTKCLLAQYAFTVISGFIEIQRADQCRVSRPYEVTPYKTTWEGEYKPCLWKASLETLIKVFKFYAILFSARLLPDQRDLGLSSSAWNKIGRILTILDAATLLLPKIKHPTLIDWLNYN